MSEEGQGAAGPGQPPAAEGAALALDDAALHDASTEVSHPTTITQIGCGAAPATESNKWSCEVCTYENYPLSRKCTMCRSPKPALNEDIFNLQDGASALPHRPPGPHDPPDPTGAESLSERLKPLRISSPGAHCSAAALNKWSCSTCTYENWPRSQRCAMCGCPAAAPEPPASAPPEWLWLQACRGVVEGSGRCVQAWLAAGGDAARALTAQEVALLDRPSAFDVGHTLVHLAIRFQRQEILSMLLSRISGGGSGIKRSPSYIAPDLAAAIRRQLAASVRYKKGPFPCRYINDCPTFMLPAEISELSGGVQAQLLGELLDGEAQRALEAPHVINWSRELAPLHALWNRSAGDCLPDAAAQAACGVADRDNTLRAALHDSMLHAQRPLYARFAAWERAQALRLQYEPEESQLRAEWARAVQLAGAAGAPLHQLHVFVLAHVLRRPLLVYAVELVASHRGEPLGHAGFQGVYLPLLWDAAVCSPSPLCLGYTRGHFSALVSVERGREAWLPLQECGGAPLPVPYLTAEEDAGAALRRWTRAVRTRAGVLACRQRAPPRPLPAAQLLEEWLNHYRRLDAQHRFPPQRDHH